MFLLEGRCRGSHPEFGHEQERLAGLVVERLADVLLEHCRRPDLPVRRWRCTFGLDAPTRASAYPSGTPLYGPPQRPLVLSPFDRRRSKVRSWLASQRMPVN